MMMKLPMTRFLSTLATLAIAAFAVSGQQPTEADLNRMVKLEGIEVKGTRILTSSITAISGLKPGADVNDAIVRRACSRVQSTGLVKKVDYLYLLYPDRPAVRLSLTVEDEAPLLPASIKPASEDAALWTALQGLDPVFTRNLPPTEKALRFYAHNLERCLKQLGRTDEYILPSVVGDKDGNATAIVFEVRKLR